MKMIEVYANLVIHGLKKIEDIPSKLRLAVETLIEKSKS